jgi:hypothetical protein
MSYFQRLLIEPENTGIEIGALRTAALGLLKFSATLMLVKLV